MAEDREQPESGQSDPLPSSTNLPFSDQSLALRGAETIVHTARGSEESDSSSRPGSTLWNRLFPVDVDDEQIGGSPVEGPVGLELGHFRIEERIGAGGMGAVFRALDMRLRRIVALKVLSPHFSRDSAAVQRFQNEARAAAQLDHENIARVFYSSDDKGLHFIAFEYVTGTNIRDLIQQYGRLAPADAVNFTLQITTALQHTAGAGVIHRDIKPSNIIVTPTGRAKLVDLGLARKQASEASGELTTAGTTLGTFDYISPEQAKDPRNVDARSDIYSLGCTLYHMLTGEPPYADGTLLQKLLHHQGNEPPNPAFKAPGIPPELSSVVRKMMASDPNSRYQTPEQLNRELMWIAQFMGLRAVYPDGLIWTSLKPQGARVWERHAGWIATVPVLLLIVGLLYFFPSFGLRTDSDTPDSVSAAVASQSPENDATRTAGGASSKDPRSGNDLADTASGSITGSLVESSSEPGKLDSQRGSGTTAGAGIANNTSPSSIPGLSRGDQLKLFDEVPFLAIGNGSDESLDGDPASANDGSGPRTTVAAAPGTTLETTGTSGSLPGLSSYDSELAEEGPAISIVTSDISQARSFSTLKAACAAAENGAIIELRFNGVRREKPIRIDNKSIHIRAAKGYQPILEFAPVESTSGVLQEEMITVVGGSLNLINLQLSLTADPARPAKHWALFSVRGAETLQLQQVTITFKNPTRRPAAVMNFFTMPGRSLSEMEMMGSARFQTDVTMTDCFVRGEADLLQVEHSDSCRFKLEHSVIALDGVLFNLLGDNFDDASQNSLVELALNHVTCLLSGSVVRMDSGDYFRMLPVVQVTADNNIFATNSFDALVSMVGETDPEEFRSLLVWKGHNNFYDRYLRYWTIVSSRGTSRFEPLSFSDWVREWDSMSEVDPHEDPIKWRHPWWTSDFSETTASDAGLDREADYNPAVEASPDNSDAGADLTRIPALRTAPLQEQGQSRPSTR